MSALKQISDQEKPVLTDWDEESFSRAFGIFRPIIQGTVDVDKSLTQAEIAQTVECCVQAFGTASPEEQDTVMHKLAAINNLTRSPEGARQQLGANLSADERRILTTIQARQIIRTEDTMNIDNLTLDVIDGMVPNLQRGSLGLTRYVPTAHASHRDDVRTTLGLPDKQISIFSLLGSVLENC